MKERLSQGELDSLSPLLSMVSEHVGAGMTPRASWLRALLSQSFGGDSPLALKELQLWADILQKAKAKACPQTSAIALLQERGVPEAYAVLAVNKASASPRPLLVGVCGRSCCGKGMAAEAIASVNYPVLHVNIDSFFRARSPARSRGYQNWDCPEALMMDTLTEVVSRLRSGDRTSIPSRGWTESFDVDILPTDLRERSIVLVEGFLLFASSDLADLFDSRIFIDVSDLNILYRRLLRERGMHNINYIYEVVIPLSKKYQQKQKAVADIVIDGDGTKDKVIRDVTREINCLLSKRKPDCSLRLFGKESPWKVRFGDLLTDHHWHPIDFQSLKPWVQQKRGELESGRELAGHTFQYRKNQVSSVYEVRLSTRNIYRYDQQSSPL